MFIQIPSKDVFFSDNCGLVIRCIDEPFFLNLDSLIQVEFQACIIHKVFANHSVRLEHLIKFYVLADEGIWNFMTLYFTKNSYEEFQYIQKLITERDNHVKK